MEGDKIKSFTDLRAWREAHKLVLMVYKVTDKFPKTEMFGLMNQMRRASVSVSSNIAEGFGRNGNKEKCQFYYIASSSLIELQNQLLISKDVGYISKNEFGKIASQTVTTAKIISGLKRIKNMP
ncbi:MAG: four helix bundle protein [Parcubacteria group bacterium]|jgi:four helix bundle protein